MNNRSIDKGGANSGDLQISVPFTEQFVTTCYEQILGRAPEREGLESHMAGITKLEDLPNVIKVFCESSEFKSRVRALPKATRFSSSDSVLHFVHIHKTAGMSIHEWLNTVFQDKLFPSYYIEDLVRLRDKLTKYQVFSGHFFGTLDLFLGAPSKKATLLRDPLDRALSHYYHILRDPTAPLHKHFQNLSFKDVICSDSLCPAIGQNYQMGCLLLLNYSATEMFWPNSVPAQGLRSIEDSAREAIDILNNIEVVGVCEKLDTFLTTFPMHGISPVQNFCQEQTLDIIGFP